MKSNSVLGIIVAYHTDPARLHSILSALVPQCGFVLADNTEDAARSVAIRECVERHGGTYRSMNGNRGIGAAQNLAIGTAWDLGAGAVLLLDDDSIPSPDLVNVLASCRSPIAGELAVFCAGAKDASGKDISNVRHLVGRLTRCRDMMSSGSFIPREVFQKVGPFDEDLFIDGVDFEWGWRARSAGLGIYVCRGTWITHRLGEGEIAGVRVPSPIRHYYQFRNVLRLMTRSSTPWMWRITQSLKLPIKLLLIAMVMPDRAKRLRFSTTGVRDAIRGRCGKFNDAAVAVWP